MANPKNEIKVFIIIKASVCSECQKQLERKSFITLLPDKGALCLECADLDHLYYLPAGDAALTRRSKKYSRLWAVVLKWSRARKRYERQGLLVEKEALEKAEAECLADADARVQRQLRAAKRREKLDQQYVVDFAGKIREYFPGCSVESAHEIAEHACSKYSGRVGRSAAAKEFSEEAIRLAVIAHIRHRETDYDELLISGYERWEARRLVDAQVFDVLEQWGQAV